MQLVCVHNKHSRYGQQRVSAGALCAPSNDDDTASVFTVFEPLSPRIYNIRFIDENFVSITKNRINQNFPVVFPYSFSGRTFSFRVSEPVNTGLRRQRNRRDSFLNIAEITTFKLKFKQNYCRDSDIYLRNHLESIQKQEAYAYYIVTCVPEKRNITRASQSRKTTN